jgi:hypothetical protein
LNELPETIAERAWELILLSAETGMPDVTSSLQLARMQPESAGIPIVVYGQLDDLARDTFTQAGATLCLEGADAAQLTEVALNQLAHLEATNGGGHPVEASTDELSLPEVLEVLRASGRSGRLEVRSSLGDALLFFERGEIVSAVFGERSGSAAVTALKALSSADYLFDPHALFPDVPAQSA